MQNQGVTHGNLHRKLSEACRDLENAESQYLEQRELSPLIKALMDIKEKVGEVPQYFEEYCLLYNKYINEWGRVWGSYIPRE